LKDANYKRTIKERVKNAQGVKELVEKKQTVKKWWIVSSNGSVAFFVRSGKLVEFEKGKTAIIAQSLDKLPATIDLLIAAVKSGELDAQLEQAGKAVGQRKREAA